MGKHSKPEIPLSKDEVKRDREKHCSNADMHYHAYYAGNEGKLASGFVATRTLFDGSPCCQRCLSCSYSVICYDHDYGAC